MPARLASKESLFIRRRGRTKFISSRDEGADMIMMHVTPYGQEILSNTIKSDAMSLDCLVII